jgi:hypothetical protein
MKYDVYLFRLFVLCYRGSSILSPIVTLISSLVCRVYFNDSQYLLFYCIFLQCLLVSASAASIFNK